MTKYDFSILEFIHATLTNSKFIITEKDTESIMYF
jgi:hypothetical protein